MITYTQRSHLVDRLGLGATIVFIEPGNYGFVLSKLIGANDRLNDNKSARIIGDGYSRGSDVRMAVHHFCRDFGWNLEAMSSDGEMSYSLVRN